MADAHGFARVAIRWWLTNAIAFPVAHVAYAVIGHGITGHHEEVLTAAQYLSHTLGLIVAALAILSAQTVVLKSLIAKEKLRILIGTVLYVIVFWAGFEVLGPPFDWLLGFAVLSAAMWIGTGGVTFRNAVLTILAITVFVAGLFAVGPVMGSVAAALGLDQESTVSFGIHILIWLIISGVAGIFSSFLNAWPISVLLSRVENSALDALRPGPASRPRLQS